MDFMRRVPQPGEIEEKLGREFAKSKDVNAKVTDAAKAAKAATTPAPSKPPAK